ncbi:MAG TPA: UdgX family uracil-DNA binding protein [Acidimicrobiia bacterium]|nr:UdgX family uracil-DNA binding protein [Acidimicrobiia bacterium]
MRRNHLQERAASTDVETQLDAVRGLAGRCRACDLWKSATATVFGEGAAPAELMFLGEQPGDHEDREGHPFVGPAGHMLDKALADAGIDRNRVYLSNAVKHFKFVRGRNGKTRIHKSPNRAEIAACRQWWERELQIVQPVVLGLLGATAAQTVLGPAFRVSKQRGERFVLPSGIVAIATVHPSAVLRAREDRAGAYAGFVNDLRLMAAEARAPSDPD